MEKLQIQKLLRGTNLTTSIDLQIEVKDEEKENLNSRINRFFKKYAYCENIDYLIESILNILNNVSGYEVRFLWSGQEQGNLFIREENGKIKNIDYQTNFKSGIFSYNWQDEKENISISENTLNFQGILNILKAELKKINFIKNRSKKAFVTYDEEAIIKIYQLFYGKNPDFLSENIYSELKNMLWLLAHYGSCVDDVNFYMDSKNKIQSNYLILVQNRLAPVDLEPIFAKNDIKLNNELKRTIAILHAFLVKDRSSEETNYLLERMCLVNYAKDIVLKSNATDDDIGKFLKVPQTSVADTLELTRKVTNEIKNS